MPMIQARTTDAQAIGFTPLLTSVPPSPKPSVTAPPGDNVLRLDADWREQQRKRHAEYDRNKAWAERQAAQWKNLR